MLVCIALSSDNNYETWEISDKKYLLYNKTGYLLSPKANKSPYELKWWRNNPSHQNVKPIKSSLPDLTIQTDMLSKRWVASCKWTLKWIVHWKNIKSRSMFQNFEQQILQFWLSQKNPGKHNPSSNRRSYCSELHAENRRLEETRSYYKISK